jgi:hypothetical protein
MVGLGRKILVRKFRFWHFWNDFVWGHVGGKLLMSRELLLLALSLFFFSFLSFFIWSLIWGLLLACRNPTLG